MKISPRDRFIGQNHKPSTGQEKPKGVSVFRSSTKCIDLSGHFGSGEPEDSPERHIDKGMDVGVEL